MVLKIKGYWTDDIADAVWKATLDGSDPAISGLPSGSLNAVAVQVPEGQIRELGALRMWGPQDMTSASLLSWGDASDAGTLWADLEMTTPATTTVRVIGDKSGTGYHAVASSENMPTIVSEGAPSGLNCLNHAAGKSMVIENDGEITGADPRFFMIVMKASSSAARMPIFLGPGGGSRVQWRWQAFDDSGTIRYQAGVSGSDIHTMPFLPSSAGVSGLFQESSTIMTAVHNGTRYTEFASLGGAANTNAGVWSLGGASTSTDRTLGEFCEWILGEGMPSEEEIEDLTGYFAHKWGYASELPIEHPRKSEPRMV